MRSRPNDYRRPCGCFTSGISRRAHGEASSLRAVPDAVGIQPDEVDLDRFDVILDVRPNPESASRFPGARHVPLDDVLRQPDRYIPSVDTVTLIVCDIGQRSQVVAERLADEGYGSIRSLIGGIDAWRAQGRPLVHSGLTAQEASRYDRQVKLREVGIGGQSALLASTVTVVGAGGLGLPAIAYLAAAGVGHLRVIDPDIIELSNLHRQPLLPLEDVGSSKVAAVGRYVRSVNPDITFTELDVELHAGNAEGLLNGSDVVLDATDRFASRYAISDAAHTLGIPVVTGAVYRWEGQLTILAPEGPCYRCLFPAQAPAIDVDCAITGVIGPVVGTIGTMQAVEAIKLITGVGSTVAGRLVLFDALSATSTSVRVTQRNDCPVCNPPS